MKKYRFTCRILALLLALLLLQMPVSAAQPTEDNGEDTLISEETGIDSTTSGSKRDASIENGCHTIDGRIPFLGMDQRVKNVEAALIYDFNNDTLMYAWNADQQILPASLVKIMTAYIVAQTEDLETEVTIPENYVFTISDSYRTSNLKPGETITLRNLLYCILVGSSNDACIIAAEHLYGSQGAFVEEMNRQAQELGCKATAFSDVTGLDEESQYSSARDMGRILAAAMKDEDFRKAFCTSHYTVPATNLSDPRRMVTNNYLVHTDVMKRYYDSRVTGGRIAMNSNGKRSLAVTATRNDIELVCITIGSSSTYTADGSAVVDFGGFDETSDLLDLGFKGFALSQIIYANQALMQYDVVNGECDVILCPKDSVTVILPYNTNRSDLSFRFSSEYEGIAAPIEKGARVSAVEVWYRSLCIAQVDLYAMNQVRVQERVDVSVKENTAGSEGIPPFLIVVIIVAVLLVLLLGRRFIFRMIYKSRVRRYRKNRRRSR